MPLKRGLSLRHRNAVKFNTRCKQRSIENTDDKENTKPKNLLDSTVSSFDEDEEEEEKKEEREQLETEDDIYHAYLALLEHNEIKGLLAYDRCR